MPRVFAAACAAVLFSTAVAQAKRAPRPIVYTAPAGDRATGILGASKPFDAILPNGRIVAPIGTSTIVGADARGLALTPDGRYAVVGTASGITVVDTASMRAVGAYDVQTGLSPGIAIAPDPQDGSKTLVIVAGTNDNLVHVLDLSADGTLSPDGDAIAMPTTDAPPAGAYVPSIVVSTDGRTAYVVHRNGGSMSAVDLVQHQILSDTVVGFSPAGIATANGRVVVTNEGLGVGTGGAPDLDRSSSMDVLTALSDGDIDGDQGSAAIVRLDPYPDSITAIGGAHPSAVVLSPDGQFAFVCMTGVDRVEVVGLAGTPHAIGGISMQLYTGWPYGTQPIAIAESADGRRLYVALADVNAVAILDSSDPLKLRRLGLLPTGWYPSGVTLSPDGRYLYVVNAKGTVRAAGATLQRIDLHALDPGPVTLSSLRYNRIATFSKPSYLVPAMLSRRRSNAIRHVVFVNAPGASLDDAIVQSEMPNLTALAFAFASAGNFTPDSDDPAQDVRFALSGQLTDYQRTAPAWTLSAFGRDGSIFDSLRLAGLSQAMAGVGQPADPSVDFDYVEIGQPGGPDGAAQADRSLGSAVDALTHSPQWASMAIFVLDRGRLVVVSPYARRSYVGHRHVSTVSVLKTEEELLGLPALSLGDLLATDLSDFFSSSADSAPYVTVTGAAARSGPASGVEHSASQ